MADFVIKRGDTRPTLAAQLKDRITVDGVTTESAINLTSAASVTFFMRQQGAQSPLVNANCTFVDRPEGRVLYSWATPDTVAVGIFDAEFQITWGDGTIETVPNDVPAGHSGPYYTVEVKQDLA